MKLTVHPVPGSSVEVEAVETEHPELAIHQIDVRELPRPIDTTEVKHRKTLGKVWAVSHIPSGHVVIYGLLTEDLATAAAEMLTGSGVNFGPGLPVPYFIDAFQAAASLMADCYFSNL